MDTSFWTNLNPTIKIIDTKKKFFNQYLYKIVLRLPGGRLTLDNRGLSMESLVERREQIHNYRYFNRSQLWASMLPPLQKPEKLDTSRLKYYQQLFVQYQADIKVRVEEPKVSIYSHDLNLLKTIASKDSGNLVEFHCPTDAAEQALGRGEIIIKRPSEYSYKVIVKQPANWDESTRLSIIQYLKNQKDEVKITKSLERNLQERKFWFTQTYFYCKDLSTVTFIRLIAPDAISGIYKLTYIDS